MSVGVLRSGFKDVCSYGLEGIFGNGKGDGIIGLSVCKSEFPFLERDVIKGDSGDLNGP